MTSPPSAPRPTRALVITKYGDGAAAREDPRRFLDGMGRPAAPSTDAFRMSTAVSDCRAESFSANSSSMVSPSDRNCTSRGEPTRGSACSSAVRSARPVAVSSTSDQAACVGLHVTDGGGRADVVTPATDPGEVGPPVEHLGRVVGDSEEDERNAGEQRVAPGSQRNSNASWPITVSASNRTPAYFARSKAANCSR